MLAVVLGYSQKTFKEINFIYCKWCPGGIAVVLDKDTCGILFPADVKKINLTYDSLVELKKTHLALQRSMHANTMSLQEAKRSAMQYKYEAALLDSSGRAKSAIIDLQEKKISSQDKRLKFDGWIFKGIGLVAIIFGIKYTFTH